MSNAAVNWVKQLVVGKASAKSVLRELADVARDKPTASSTTGKCWPAAHAYLSVVALEKSTELDRKTVMAGLKFLQEKGFIRLAGKDGRTGQVQVFELLISGTQNSAVNDTKNGTVNSTEIGTVSKNQTVPIHPANSTVFPAEQYRFSHETVPKTGYEPILNPIEPNKTPIGATTQQPTLDGIAPKSKRAKPKHPRPENFEPNATAIALCKTHGFDPATELEKFKNHHDSKGNVFADWQAAFRTWLTKAHEFSLNRNTRTSPSRHAGFTPDKYEEAANVGIVD